MKVSYNIPYPSQTRNMGENLRKFYEFYDDPSKLTMCYEFDTKEEANSCSVSLASARWRRELKVEIKKVANKVFVRKVGQNA
jgi:hypothetical protein